MAVIVMHMRDDTTAASGGYDCCQDEAQREIGEPEAWRLLQRCLQLLKRILPF